jgi:hypothetical protein
MAISHDVVKDQHQGRSAHAAEVLRRLDQLGAIKLDVLIEKSSEIGSILGSAELDAEDRICYPFMIQIGPRHDIDLVSVANELRQLGFEIRPMKRG